MIQSIIIYDQHFNLNEIIVFLFLSSYILVWIAPKRFSVPMTLLLLLYGPFSATFFDNLIGIQRINYYDINDTSLYNVYDALLYIGYGPFGYFFIYFYEKLRLRRMRTLFYILIWSLFSIGIEFVVSVAGVFHYLNNYSTFYSFPVYVGLQIIMVILFNWMKEFEKEFHYS